MRPAEPTLIDNHSQQPYGRAMRLDELPPRHAAKIAGIDWTMLDEKVARRLQELGFDEGVAIETLHRGPISLDPIAVRVGRMTIALRKAVAGAVTVVPA